MLGGVAGRHMSNRRRGSSPAIRNIEDIPPSRYARRRRAVTTSDHKSCALIQTRLKQQDIISEKPNPTTNAAEAVTTDGFNFPSNAEQPNVLKIAKKLIIDNFGQSRVEIDDSEQTSFYGAAEKSFADNSNKSAVEANFCEQSGSPQISFIQNLDKSDIEKNVSEESDLFQDSIIVTPKNMNSRDILPMGALNLEVTQVQPSNYRDCKFTEGLFMIGVNEFRSVHNYGGLIPGKWTYLLSKKLNIVNNVCVINFKNKRHIKAKDQYKIYAYCSHPMCKKFIITIDNISKSCEHLVTVVSTSRDYFHSTKLTRQLKGEERKIAKRELEYVRPIQAKYNRIQKASSPSIIAGNLQDIKSDNVIRKARSEKLAALDRHKDDIIDMLLMQRQNCGYIKMVGQPFTIYIFSKKQVELVSEIIRNKSTLPILHLDATGNVVRNPQNMRKRILYYAAVVNIEGRILPILEMHTCDHDSVTIGT
ncbi:hypothetical protein MML48_6g00009974 [Holotrichia oblita]|uniref:Uncharacterized protein n=1 Tax=Holotrichia oblita TaxID=644536 RepID=A0ACB9SXS5_HOLOL|nr:hypothetical protein MML48_6g00009974 [Holotrichia oblita]